MYCCGGGAVDGDDMCCEMFCRECPSVPLRRCPAIRSSCQGHPCRFPLSGGGGIGGGRRDETHMMMMI